MAACKLSNLFMFLLAILSNLVLCDVAILKPFFVNAATESASLDAAQFNAINRRQILSCTNPNPFLTMSLSTAGPLDDVQEVAVTVSGVLVPSDDDWVGVFSAASHNYSACPAVKALYIETGDISSLPLLCDYPVKSKFLKEDPSYLSCSKKHCRQQIGSQCLIHTCNASLTFRLINIRTPISFVYFAGGFDVPCILRKSEPLQFRNPNSPLYAHLSSTDSTGTSIRVTWLSGSSEIQAVQYAGGKSVPSTVSTFRQTDMCIPAPATNFGWHDPGYVHSAVISGLSPSSTYTYKYGSNFVGWSGDKIFKTPPAAGAEALQIIIYGDMGKADADSSTEHYIQPGSLGVINAISQELDAGKVDAVFHIGDISYATGFLAEWDFFLEMIQPVASRIPYLTAIGNHERDFPKSGSYYGSTDSGGECGVPYETYFPMPVRAKDEPWYSVQLGPVHFTVMSTEHDWTPNSLQFKWLKNDLLLVDRRQTPWLIFIGHRPQYSSVVKAISEIVYPSVDPKFVATIEPLLVEHQVNVAFWGHVHNYERTCAVYQGKCKSLPRKTDVSIDTYNQTIYTSPVHTVVGMAGFALDGFKQNPSNWSLVRISSFGYTHVQANKHEFLVEYKFSSNGQIGDAFRIVR
ncbi:hypothetical protein O6H91_Y184800 [Diphasiastrum complanatum]|nr:hypothetical protein O6H91_Y184800 [Diphasiastrum complanatum]